MKKISVFLFIFLVSLNSYSSCYHELCVDCQSRPDITLKAKDGRWDGEQLTFRYYADKSINGVNVFANGKDYSLSSIGIGGGFFSGTRRNAWHSASLSLPFFSGRFLVTGTRPSYCAAYREPTFLERLRGIRKPN